MDEFKKYLKLHEAGLDTEKPGARVWEHVKLKTEKQPSRSFRINSWLKYAAAAILLLSIGLAIKYTTSATKDQLPEVIAKQADPSPAPPIDTISSLPAPVNRLKERNEPRNQPIATASPKRKPPGSAVVNDLENNYSQLISYQLDRIRRTPVYAEGPGYFDSFKQQFHEIEKAEAAVKKDLAKNGLNEILLDQLIEVYQQKLNVLKSFQTTIQKMNNRVEFQRKDSTPGKHYYITL